MLDRILRRYQWSDRVHHVRTGIFHGFYCFCRVVCVHCVRGRNVLVKRCMRQLRIRSKSGHHRAVKLH